MIPMEQREAVLIMRLPRSVKAALKRAAEDDHRSMSALMLKLVSDHLAANGYLTPDPKPRRSGRRS